MDAEAAELNAMLQKAFAKATEIYAKRGFQRRVGFGRRPALINVDLANAWTRPGNPFTCENIDEQIIPGVQRLLKACRDNDHPVVHVTTCYQVTDRDNPNTDMGLWHNKIPIEVVDQKNEDIWAIDSRIAPVDGEQVLVKKRASGFHGTYLAGFLRAAGVDTILVTGVTASGHRAANGCLCPRDRLRWSRGRIPTNCRTRVYRGSSARSRRMEPIRYRR